MARIYKQGGQHYILTMLQLALREATISDKITLGKALQGVLPELGDEAMGLLQQERQEGWEEGKEEGLLSGEKRAQKKMLNSMLAKGYNISKVAEITGFSLNTLKALQA